MTAYILRRLLLMIPTIFGIMLVSFTVIQFAPGGPVERVISQLSGRDTGAISRISGSSSDFGAQGVGSGAQVEMNSKYRGAQGLDPAFIKSLEKQFGFDKPAYERFFLMLWNYTRFDFGKSYFRDVSVLQLIKEKLPVSISLGIWMTLLSYLISIPLGIRKAVRDGRRSTSDLRRDHYPLRYSRVLLRSCSSCCRGRLSFRFFRCAAWFPTTGRNSPGTTRSPIIFGIDIADHLDGACLIRDDDAADQELVLEELRKHALPRAPRAAPSGGALRAHLPQRHADRHRRFSGGLRVGLLCRIAFDRDDLLARRAWAVELRKRA